MAGSKPSRILYQDTLDEAIRAKEQFLQEHPHLQPFQDEIDRVLAKTVGFQDRMFVIAFMIEARLYELRGLITNLRFAHPREEEFLNKAKVERHIKSKIIPQIRIE